ncbi:hypothetical protein FRC02_003857 [Tulasnella sp. 418]|nr:hypothetical protein FRC02_003857 [Tulasnella sp. 418]
MMCANMINASIITTYMIPQVIGLAPTLIILRIYASIPTPRSVIGHDTAPSASEQSPISRPVFASATLNTIASHPETEDTIYPGYSLSGQGHLLDPNGKVTAMEEHPCRRAPADESRDCVPNESV